MDALTFILQDTRKIAVSYQVRLAWSVILGILPGAAALLWRRDFIGLDEPTIWIGSIIISGFCAALPWWLVEDKIPSRRRQTGKYLFAVIAVVMILVVSSLHVGLPFGTVYSTWKNFWEEAFACLSKGMAISLGSSILAWFIVSRFYPLPSTRQSLGICVLSGLSGVAMLNLHCASSNIGHIVFGHWLQSLVVIIGTFAVQFWFVRRWLSTQSAPSGPVTRRTR